MDIKAKPLQWMVTLVVILNSHLMIGFPHLSEEPNGVIRRIMMQLAGHLQKKAAQKYSLFVISGVAAIY